MENAKTAAARCVRTRSRFALRRKLVDLDCRFLKKAPQKLFIAWFERILHKFSIKRSRFIGFEAPISSLHASVTAEIESSKLRKIK